MLAVVQRFQIWRQTPAASIPLGESSDRQIDVNCKGFWYHFSALKIPHIGKEIPTALNPQFQRAKLIRVLNPMDSKFHAPFPSMSAF